MREIQWAQVMVSKQYKEHAFRKAPSTTMDGGNLVPRGCIPFGQHQGCKTSGIINVKMLENRNLIGYYILPEVYEKEVSKQEIKVFRMLLLDVFDHVRDGQWERNLKMGDAN